MRYKKYELSAGPAGTGSSYYGEIIELIDVGYKIQTNDNSTYYIGFNKVFTSTNDKDLLGLSFMRLSEKMMMHFAVLNIQLLRNSL